MPPHRRRNLAVNSRPPPDRNRHPFPRPPPAGLTGPRPAPRRHSTLSPVIPATRPGHPAASPIGRNLTCPERRFAAQTA